MADEKILETEANTEFEKSVDVNLTSDQLSFICEYCGKVNSIASPRCTRCGKRRPRNEYIKAMARLKESKTVKAEYIAEQAQLDNQKKEMAQQQLVRLVEARVEDEKQQILAQQTLKTEQEADAIRKASARDAVLRVIAAEQAAQDTVNIIQKQAVEKISQINKDADVRVNEAEQKLNDVLNNRNSELNRKMEDERQKAIQIAAEKLVAERAGIEQAAREQIEANRKIAERYAGDTISEEKDKAERNAAREAVLRIIAAEKAAEDKVKLNTDAIHQAAVDRIVEERMLADKEANARFLAEKQAIERAADERIKAERAALKKLLEEKGAYAPVSGGAPAQAAYGAQTVQPFAIVPYVSSTQPVYQYKPAQVYRFVPAAVPTVSEPVKGKKAVNAEEVNASVVNDVANPAKKVADKSKAVRIMGLVSLLITAAILVFGAILDAVDPAVNLLPILSNKFIVSNNLNIVEAFLAYVINGVNAIFKSTLTVPFASGAFYTAANFMNYKPLVLIPIGFALFIIADVVVFVQSIVRLATGKGSKAGFVPSLIQLLFFIVAVVGIVLGGLNMELAVVDVLTVTGLIVFAALAVVNVVLLGVAKNDASKEKKNK